MWLKKPKNLSSITTYQLSKINELHSQICKVLFPLIRILGLKYFGPSYFSYVKHWTALTKVENESSWDWDFYPWLYND